MSLDSSSEKIDRRVLRTREALRDALSELIQEKGYDEITIEEITERANIGRATFYLHYKDKEDLLMEEFHRRIMQNAERLSKTQISVWLSYLDPGSELADQNEPPPLESIFQHIYDNKGFYYLLLTNARSGRVVERIRKTSMEVTARFITNLVEKQVIKLKEGVSVDAVAAFLNGALLSTVDWWLGEDMQHTPAELANLFRSLLFHGAGAIIEVVSN